jgi:LmbE family N-acetylglucosaminyl deacetylase
MTSQRTLLLVGAHPDDETFGSGGTLAHYAAAGVKVYYACATRGEAGTADPEHLHGHATMGDMRWSELECAARELRLAGVIHMGYRDSGMPGSEDNKHPDALIAAPTGELAERIVRIMRDLKPQVVITSDAAGGYGHPDHIAIHKATLQAFSDAGDGQRFPGAGRAYRPQKLYYPVFRRTLLKWAVRLMPLFGQDPRRQGRNKDIDMTRMAGIDFPVNAFVQLSKNDMATRDRATACYESQIAGPRREGLIGLVFRLSRQDRDYYMRGYPPAGSKKVEKDLFTDT